MGSSARQPRQYMERSLGQAGPGGGWFGHGLAGADED